MPNKDNKTDELLSVSDSNSQNALNDTVITSLTDKVEKLQASLLEERFVWVLITVILFDFMIFVHMSNWSAPIIIGLVELVILTIIARKLGIKDLEALTNKILLFSNKVKNKKTSP